MAGTIVADFIRTDANQLSLNVGNTTFATINASGFFSNTGIQLIAANGKVSGASVISGSITSAAFATAANTIPRSSMTSGAILQVLQAVKTDTQSTSSATFGDITGLSVSITPTSASSKILVTISVSRGTDSNQISNFRIMRDATAIGIGDTAGNRVRATMSMYFGSGDSVSHIGTSAMNFLDSPATTSATTYKVQFRSQQDGSITYINKNASDGDGTTVPRTISTITVMEIAG